MQQIDVNPVIKRFGAHSLWVGILLMLLGTFGIILPVILSELTVTLITSLMIASGILWLWHSFRHGSDWIDWIKPVVLLAAGILIAVKPWDGIAGLALLLAGYLAFDAFACFSLAQAVAGSSGRGWMIFNGVADAVLAVIFLWGWPQTSAMMVGLFVGISLLFDGWALAMIGWSLKRQ